MRLWRLKLQSLCSRFLRSPSAIHIASVRVRIQS
jgi:hypothetical protein